MAHIAFLTLFLGLVSGRQTVTLEADRVQSVRIELGGRTLATLDRPPWTVVIDFGGEITPQALEAIGYDERGTEVARASQVVNLPRPLAELEIVIRNERERPVLARLVGRHRSHELPKRARLSIDGKPISLSRDFSARLPALDWSRPHVLSAEMRFADGEVARRELAMAGGLGESVGSELTPVLVTTTGSQDPTSLTGCFSRDGVALRASVLEKPNALVIMVKDPDPRELAAQLVRFKLPVRLYMSKEPHELQLSGDTTERILWPVAQRFTSADEPTSLLFEHSRDVSASERGMLWLLEQRLVESPNESHPRRFADAVAVAGVSSMARPRRRAVVVVLSSTPDKGRYAPGVVRRYLEDIGVPLFVWSAAGAGPDSSGPWGAIDDISGEEGLALAIAKVNAALDGQRMAWVATDPLSALDLEVKDRCGLELVARRPHSRVATPH